MIEQGSNLRRRAEQILAGRVVDLEDLNKEDIQHLIHELQVHQIELELQNETLRNTQASLLATRDKYTDLFDFAPIGYFTIDADATIREANLTGAALLGLERGRLIGQAFSQFVVSDDLLAYHRFHRRLNREMSAGSCELTLETKAGERFYARLEGAPVPAADGESFQVRLAISNITEQKRAEKTLRANQEELERRVAERTAALAEANNSLRQQIDQRRQVEEAYQRLVDYSIQGLAIFQGQQFAFINPSCAQMTGYTVAELTTFDLDRIQALVYPDDRAWVTEVLGSHLNGKMAPTQTTFRFFHKDGRVRWVEIYSRLIEYRGEPALQIASIDVTERKQVEDKIRLLKDLIREVSTAQDFHAALAVTLRQFAQANGWHFGEAWVKESDDATLSLSPAYYHQAPDLLWFRQVSETLTLPLRSSLPGRVWASQEAVWVEDVSTEPVCTFFRAHVARRAGLRTSLAVPIIVDDHTLAVLVFASRKRLTVDPQQIELATTVATQLGAVLHRKQTADENVRLLKAVSQQRQQLRALSARLAEAQEAERKQMARELHDQVGRNLTVLGLNLNIIRSQIPDDLSQVGLIQERLGESLGLVEQTTECIRDVMANLRPPVLDDYGLLAALQWYVDQFVTWTGLRVVVDGQEPVPRLSPAVENALFRVAQEALTNVAKHAQARQVTIRMNVSTKTMQLVIIDDGRGFKSKQIKNNTDHPSWGLMTMSERAEAVGGFCEIDSTPGHGTQVLVEVPR